MKQTLSYFLSFTLLVAPLASWAQQTGTSQNQVVITELNASTEKAMRLLKIYLNVQTPQNLSAEEQSVFLTKEAQKVVEAFKSDQTLLQSFMALYTKSRIKEHNQIQQALRLSVKALKAENKLVADEKTKMTRLKILSEALNDSRGDAELKSHIAYIASVLLVTSAIASRVIIANSGYGSLTLAQEVKLTLQGMLGYFTGHLAMEGVMLAPVTMSVVMGSILTNDIIHKKVINENLEIED